MDELMETEQQIVIVTPLTDTAETAAIPDIDTQPLLDAQKSFEVEAVAAGHICLDVIPTLTASASRFAPGQLIEAGKAVLATGGPVSNTGLALHILGVSTRLMGKIGDDLFGQAIMQIVDGYGPELAAGMVIATGEASSYSLIISPPGIDRIIIHAPGCNDTFSADDVPYHLLEKVRLFHFGYPPLMACMYRNDGEELEALFQQVKARGATTSLDLSAPDPHSPAGRADWTTILARTLPYVDVFLPSIGELLFMLRRPLFDQLSAQAGETSLLDSVTPDIFSRLGQDLLDMGAGIVGIKAGHRGLYLRTAPGERLSLMGRGQPKHVDHWVDCELWSPCFATEVVGTLGSGDATIAGFLMGLLRGMPPEATLTAACAVGACNVEAPDALGGLRSWPDTLQRVVAGWPRLLLDQDVNHALSMPAFGWSWDEHHEMWVGPRNGHT